MIVYLLLNVVTEKAYVGSTVRTLKERVDYHWADARKGSEAQLHREMRLWDSEFWDAVVLQNCYDELQLSQAEAAWIALLSTREPNVGYNSRFEPLEGGKQRGMQRKREQMTEEERERFRTWGKLGAEKSKRLRA
jgi:hypothetical protein